MHKNRRGYWYRSKRVGTRIEKEYIGRGAWCESSAQLDRLDRQSEAAAKALARSQRDEMEARDREAKAAFDAVTLAVAAALESLGFHQHARGQWRKRRASNQGENSVAKTKAIEVQSEPQSMTAQIALAREDASAAADLWKRMDANGTAEMFVRSNDIAFNAELSLIKTTMGEDVLVREMAARRLALLRRDLLGENPTPLEKLLVTRIAMCWQSVNYWEAITAQRNREGNWAGVELFTKYLDRAHKRYLASIKALATVRKLQVPNVQVNIGEKQVNVAQMNAPKT